MKKIIVTGGTGSIGKKLKDSLLLKGYQVIILSRRINISNDSLVYWDPKNKKIDIEILRDTYALIHLAGANIAESRWSNKRKLELATSRVDSLEFLFDSFKEIQFFPKVIISSSAVGYYGAKTVENIFKEDNLPGNDFIGKLCNDWEKAALNFQNVATRVVILRTGVVLSKELNGMLQKILPIFKLGLGSAIGSGEQYFSWVHIDDVVNCFIHSLEKETMNGCYNLVSPEIITNKDFSKELANVLKKPFFLPPIPQFVLKLMFGELECILTQGSKISSEKLINAKFNFKFNKVNFALNSLLNV